MRYLNSQQLAFILDIKKADARLMMCNAWTRSKGIEKEDFQGTAIKGVTRKKTKIEDSYPNAMPIEMLSAELNLPNLQQVCDDIENNYLVRSATKRYILRDYPEKLILKTETEGKQFPVKISIPPALKSMLPVKDQQTILNYWKEFKCANNDPRFIIEWIE
jgi:hypothetical protein